MIEMNFETARHNMIEQQIRPWNVIDPVALDALEFSPRVTREEVKKMLPQTGDYSLITSSDAHYLDDIGKSSTTFLMEKVSIEEIKLALQGKDGRKVIF